MRHGSHLRFLHFLSAILLITAAIMLSGFKVYAAPVYRNDRFNKSFAYSPDPVTYFINIARAQKGKTTAELGYGGAWCAYFVNDCAKLAGVQYAVCLTDTDGGFAYQIYDNVINSGGRVLKATEKPQAGDIVFYHNNFKSYERYCHVAIMSSDTLSIHGNFSSQVFADIPVTYYKLSSGNPDRNNYSVTYLRPNYKEKKETADKYTEIKNEETDKAGTADIDTDPEEIKRAISIKKGQSFKDSKTKARYVVITAGKIPQLRFEGTTSKTAKTITIPATVKYKGITCKVTAVASKALKNNKNVTKVKLGKNVKKIGSKAFYGCTKLAAVQMYSGYSVIGNDSFYKIKKKAKFTIIAKDKKSAKQLLGMINKKGGALSAKLVYISGMGR